MKNKIIITAGGTSERIDNVRRITNNSTGKLGSIIANTLIQKYNDKLEQIYFICPENSCTPILDEKIKIINIFDTNDLKIVIEKLLTTEKIDFFLHSMAVSDYTVDYIVTAEMLAKSIVDASNVSNNNSMKIDTINSVYKAICENKETIKENKISSNEENLIIKLKKAPKIISLIKTLSPSTFLVGFKLLDGVSKETLLTVAKKLRDKNSCNLVVANDLSTIKNGKHEAFIIKENNEYIEASGKEDIAEKLLKELKL